MLTHEFTFGLRASEIVQIVLGTSGVNVRPVSTNEADFVSAETFGSALGQAVWLMTMSKAHRDLPIRDIEAIAATPILPKQFKIYSTNGQPVAFLSWARVTEELANRADISSTDLALENWRSGDNLIVVDCVSPFSGATEFERRFLMAGQFKR